MKINRLEVYALRAPAPERPHWTSHFIVPTANEILVKLYTDEGIEGFGLATSYTPIDFAIKAWQGDLAEQIVGEDAEAVDVQSPQNCGDVAQQVWNGQRRAGRSPAAVEPTHIRGDQAEVLSEDRNQRSPVAAVSGESVQ